MRYLRFCFLLIIFFCLSFLPARKLGELREVLEPDMIDVYGNELYVLEKATVFVYSLKNLKLIRKIGKAGEGPGELKVTQFLPNCITVYSEFIFAECFDKIIFLKKMGR